MYSCGQWTLDNELWTLNIGYCLVALNFVWKCKSKKVCYFLSCGLIMMIIVVVETKRNVFLVIEFFFSADFFCV